MKHLETLHGRLALPAFMPDATRGCVRTLDSADVEACGIEVMMVNAMHLAADPGASLIKSCGGIHQFMDWRGPLASDSGGFQALSLATGPSKLGTVTSEGISYRARKGGAKKHLTPEKCIEKQLQLGTDILFCLDHCTHPNMDAAAQRESVTNTLAWARRCKEEFERRLPSASRPLLFGVVQGGNDPQLREECFNALAEIGFDGYGFGGWPVGNDGALIDAVFQLAELTGRNAPLHGLGIGKPESVVRAAAAGYTLFDCVLPTRDARHERLYCFTETPTAGGLAGDFYETIAIGNECFARDSRAIESTCDCLCCTRYSRAYLHHLFTQKETAGQRLATIHNLRFYARLMEALREQP